MNAKQFLTLLSRGNSLQQEDISELLRLQETFPYFPIPIILAAKYGIGQHDEASSELLHWAAIESPDRLRLKDLIENKIDFLPDYDKPTQTSETGENLTVVKNNEETELPIQEKPIQYNRDEILKKLEDNLNRFKQTSKKPLEETSKENSGQLGETHEIKPKEEDFIEAIKKKEKKQILDSRKKEQNELIKAFNKKSTRLAVIRENEEANLTDLSTGSTAFNDNLISESYAKLLAQQDKNDKAIEIYQKLILKFPDKTAYFAALIKELEG